MLARVILIIAILRAEIANGAGGGNWGYHYGTHFASPDKWKDIPGTSCGGSRQSPINVVSARCIYWKKLMPITVPIIDSKLQTTLMASATSIYLSFNDQWIITFSGEGCFRAISIHWHWGLQNGRGSEHFIDANQYDMEGHIVTYNCNLYNDSATAKKSPSGLYVFSVLYKIGDQNTALSKVTPYVNTVLYNKQATLPEISPREFMPSNLAEYYRYEGSLTTPPCTENVIWTIFREIQTVSESQLSTFRSLKFGPPEHGYMGDNFRPVAPMQSTSEYIKRFVYGSFPCGSIKHDYFALLMFLFVSLTLWIVDTDFFAL